MIHGDWMEEMRHLLKEAGYSDKALDYYIGKVNLGEVDNPTIKFSYTGPCGDTMEVYLKVVSGVIEDAKFRTIGCPGAFVSGSALTEIVKGKTLEQAEKVGSGDIVKHLGGIPQSKLHCACLAERTLRKAIREHLSEK